MARAICAATRCVALAALLLPAAGQAFGLKTHVWIGQEIAREIELQCEVRLGSSQAKLALDPQVCSSIQAHRGAFLAGVLGPDVYPDLVTGQITTHPGIEDDWATADWLVHLYGDTAPGAELAFAAGYMVHAASDVFAHTYVNAYAGGIFELKGEQAIEVRHFLLEKYIDSRLPRDAAKDVVLEPPTAFVRDKLIHHPDAGRLAAKAGARHVQFMHARWARGSALARELQDAEAGLQAVRGQLPRDEQQERSQERELEDQLRNAEESARDLQLVRVALAFETSRLQHALSASAGLGTSEVLAARQQYAQAAGNLRSIEEQLERARQRVRDLKETLATTVQRLKVLAQAARRLPALLDRSRAVRLHARNWLWGMQLAADEYIGVSAQVGQSLLTGQPTDAVSSYADWAQCAGQAYFAIPVQYTRAKCILQDAAEAFERDMEELTQVLLPEPYDRYYAKYLAAAEKLRRELKEQARDASVELSMFAASNYEMRELIKLLAGSELASRQALDDAFVRPNPAPGGGQLLAIPRVSDLVDRDMGVREGVLDPGTFAALHNALVLSKLALADDAAVRELVHGLGADPALLPRPAGRGRHSVLFDMVRSIDGNHQWQPYGLPWPREGSPPGERPALPSYGYGPGSSSDGSPREGFALFIHPQLRSQVFQRLFKGPVSGALTTLGPMQPDRHPFAECAANPFPVAFEPDGRPRSRDPGCDPVPAAPPAAR